MVHSRINEEIEYNENQDLDNEDQDLDVVLWEYNLFDMPIHIALGNKHEEKGVEYYPIYLILNDRVRSKIGIFEMINADDYLDDDGDLDITDLNEPLLFSFVSKAYLMEELMNKEQIEDNEDEKDEKEDSLKEIESSSSLSKKEDSLPEQTQQMAEDENEIVDNDDATMWVSKYLENPNFKVIEVGADGNCLLYVIEAALNSKGNNITVKEIRQKLANEANEAIYQNYKILYNDSKKENEDLKKEAKTLKTQYENKKEEFKKTIDRDDQIKLKDEANKLSHLYKSIITQKGIASEYMQEFEIMEGVESLEEFKKKIQTCEFWADQWAISTLERILNIKLIIFSYQSYLDKDYDNVLQCGMLDDPILSEKKIFEPDYYIMTNYLGRHYQKIEYKGHLAFTFPEIMWKIKKKIVDKCLDVGMGPFTIIPDFKKFKEEQHKHIEMSEPSLSSENTTPDLFDDDVVFILSHDAGKQKKPVDGEKIPDNKKNEYLKLFENPYWRRPLSDMYEKEYTCDNKRWLTTEHYIQAERFKLQPEIYNEFALDSNSEMSKDPNIARSYGTNSSYKKKKYRPTDVKPDPSYNESIAYNKVYLCKVEQIPEFKETLINTKRAKLLQKIRYKKVPRQQDELMKLRKTL